MVASTGDFANRGHALGIVTAPTVGLTTSNAGVDSCAVVNWRTFYHGISSEMRLASTCLGLTNFLCTDGVGATAAIGDQFALVDKLAAVFAITRK